MKTLKQLIAVLALCALAGCATYQGPTRDADAFKRNKQKQKELKRTMGHNRMSG